MCQQLQCANNYNVPTITMCQQLQCANNVMNLSSRIAYRAESVTRPLIGPPSQYMGKAEREWLELGLERGLNTNVVCSLINNY